MPNRLLAALVLALTAALGATGCADDVSPALTVGDTKIGNDALMDEVEQWASSPTLLAALQLPSMEGARPGSYPQALVGMVAANRVTWEVHKEQFDELGLELTDEDRDMVRSDLFGDPTATQAVFQELSESYGNSLVEDLAKQFEVSEAMGADYQMWVIDALGADDISVNPRYGTWNGSTAQITPPSGPVQPFATFP